MFLIPVIAAAVMPAFGLAFGAEVLGKGAEKMRQFRRANEHAAAVASMHDGIDIEKVEAQNVEKTYTPAGGAEKLMHDLGAPKSLASGLASQMGHNVVLLPSQAARVAAALAVGDEEALRSLLLEIRLQSHGHV